MKSSLISTISALVLLLGGMTFLFASDALRIPRSEVMTREVMALRSNHNYSTPTAIRDVARALRKLGQVALDRVLSEMPAGASESWQTE